MLKQVSVTDLGQVDFVPQAVVRSPISYFSDRLGFKLVSDIDDLDEYESAFFQLNDSFPFALIHYRGHPPDTTTIYFGRGISQKDVPQIVSDILNDFDLPSAALVWISPPSDQNR